MAKLIGHNSSNYIAKQGQTWAVVTGGSDGIGFEICKKLADYGYNICIIGRTESKVLDKIDQIQKSTINKNLKTMHLIADFSKLNSIE